MLGKGAKLTVISGALVITLFLAGIARAESAEAPESKETKAAKQEAVLEGAVGETTELGSQGRSSIRSHGDPQRELDEILGQLVQKKEGYGESKEAQRTQTEELRHKAGSEDSAGRLSMSKERMEVRIAQLRAEARAGLLKRPPASRSGSGGAAMRERELEIAQNDIVARPVEPIPYERYVQIYKASAKRYGFTKDWYVLAAVGKVESNHGENMGPSSAGAMGPMQFLPSTWKAYGVDGNRDGVANIMDPEDAIPAAAAYLKVGGAPKDWYTALYTYNRAGWYVREVLSVAESYRRLAKDKAEPHD